MSGDLTFGWEPLAGLLDEGLSELVERHWLEIGRDKAQVPLDPDWDRYLQMEATGTWRAFAARSDGNLVGYIAAFIGLSPRYRSTLYVETDVFYIDKEHRKGRAGLEMFRAWLDALPKPCKVLLAAKMGFEDGLVGDFFERRLGFVPIEKTYSKMLEA